MVESNKIAPTTTIQDLQGVNILGSWTSATSSMVGERPEPKDKIILLIFSSSLPRRWLSGGTMRRPSTTTTRRVRTPDLVNWNNAMSDQ